MVKGTPDFRFHRKIPLQTPLSLSQVNILLGPDGYTVSSDYCPGSDLTNGNFFYSKAS